jgi:signal transduction histidine kinase/FixJ family two-component response regulator
LTGGSSWITRVPTLGPNVEMCFGDQLRIIVGTMAIAIVASFFVVGFVAILLGSAGRLRTLLESFASGRTDIHPDRISAMLWGPLIAAMRRSLQEREGLRRHAESLRRFEAIAKTTQMLAHDVRRPFTKLRSGLTMLEHVEDIEEMQRLVGRVAHQVDNDLASVNHMLGDILVAGNEVTLDLSEVDAHELLLVTLADICSLHPLKDVSLDVEFGSRRLVRADSGKLARVVANILDNALQAMPNGALLWIRTRLVDRMDRAHIEVAIGNTGSVIAPEDLPRLFEPFFTKGKKNGTGLGLSIVQRIIEAHGGEILCASSIERGTEFVFTVPATDMEASALAMTLPASSSEARASKGTNVASSINGTASYFEIRKEVALEANVRRAAGYLSRPLRVLVVDDEEIYREALEKRLVGGSRLAGAVEVRGATTASAALAVVGDWSPEVVVCDVDLGSGEYDGFDVVTQIRAHGYFGKVCVHSNRSDVRTYQAALKAGADAFLPKPMSRIHLLDMLASSGPSMPPIASDIEPRRAAGEKRATVAIVDDDVFMLEAWETALAVDAVTLTFASPVEFWLAAEATPSLLGELACVVTDYHFDNCDTDDGLSFAMAMQVRAPQVPIFISTNANVPRTMDATSIRVIDKQPVSLSQLCAMGSLRLK